MLKLITLTVLAFMSLGSTEARSEDATPPSRFSVIVQPEVGSQLRVPIVAKLKVPRAQDRLQIGEKDFVQLNCTAFVAYILVGETSYRLQPSKSCQDLTRFEGIKACQTRIEFDRNQKTVKIADGPAGQPIGLASCAGPTEPSLQATTPTESARDLFKFRNFRQ